MSDMAKNLILWLVIAVVLMSVFQSFGPGENNGRAVDYTTFVKEVGQGQIQEAQFNNGEITFMRRGGGSRYVTYMPVYDQKLLDDLINQDVKASCWYRRAKLAGYHFHLLVPNDSIDWGLDLLHASNARWRWQRCHVIW